MIMALAFAGAILVGYLLLPDDNERIAMLERDGHDRQALEILEQRFAAGDRSQRTLFQLQSLYEQKGDLPRARSTLEILAAARPRDANLQRHLSELYRTTQDEAAYIRSLEERLAARYAQPVCKELIGLYRRKGRFDDEQRTLAGCRAKGYRRTDDIVRLAHLIAADGKLAEAAALLSSVDDRRQLREDSDRLMLFAALLEAGAADEAKRRAARWFKGSRDDALVLQIIDTLAGEARYELAIDLAREVGKPGDAISLAVGELLLDRDQTAAARSYLRGWLESARLGDLDVAQRIVRAALDAEDPMLAYEAGRKFGLARLAQEDLVALAEALSAVEQTEAFQAVRAVIPAGLLKENLLLSAALEVDQGKPEPARQLLSRVQVKALDEWRLALWARLMASTGRSATAAQTLRDIAAEVGTGAPRIALPVPSLAPQASPAAPPAVTTGPEPLPTPAVGAPQPLPPFSPPSAVSGRPTATPAAGVAPPRLVRRRAPDYRTPRRSRLKRPLGPPPSKGKMFPAPLPFPSPG
ncbi:MAG: tetratricopeptide repeat protein [Hyphomicrobiaceae bacterium]